MDDKRGPEIDTEIYLSIFKSSVYSGHSNWYKINGHSMTGFQIYFKYKLSLHVLISVKFLM